MKFERFVAGIIIRISPLNNFDTLNIRSIARDLFQKKFSTADATAFILCLERINPFLDREFASDLMDVLRAKYSFILRLFIMNFYFLYLDEFAELTRSIAYSTPEARDIAVREAHKESSYGSNFFWGETDTDGAFEVGSYTSDFFEDEDSEVE
jgi:hypothetical protein